MEESKATSPFTPWWYIRTQLTTKPVEMCQCIKFAFGFSDFHNIFPDSSKVYLLKRYSNIFVVFCVLQEIVDHLAAVMNYLMSSHKTYHNGGAMRIASIATSRT